MKIFLSSTAYDLIDFRAMIVDLLESKGHEVLYHESPTFPARKLGLHSHDQCILAVEQCDLVLCVIDKRYGGRYSGSFVDRFRDQTFRIRGLDKNDKSRSFDVVIPAKDLSITWCELITAYDTQKYVITFARQRTLDEKETRRANQHLKTFRPAFAEKNELFDLLDWITKQKTSNWIASFNTIVDFKVKLEKWINELEETIIPDPKPNLSPSEKIKIGIIVEGEVDRYVINRIISSQGFDADFAIIPTYGKYRILNEFKTIIIPYLNMFDKVFIVLDSDTKSSPKISSFKHSLSALVPEKYTSKVKFILATPSIESWIVAGLNTAIYREFGGMIDKDTFVRLYSIPSVRNIKQILDTEYDPRLAIGNDPNIQEFMNSIGRVLESR